MSFVVIMLSGLGALVLGLWVLDRRKENVSWTDWLLGTGVTVAAMLLLPIAVAALSTSAAYSVPVALPALLALYSARSRPPQVPNWRRRVLTVGLWGSVAAGIGFFLSLEYIRQTGPYSGGSALAGVVLASSLAGCLALFGRGAPRVLGFAAAACGFVLSTGAAIAQ